MPWLGVADAADSAALQENSMVKARTLRLKATAG